MTTPRFDARIVNCDPEEYFKREGFSSGRAKTVIARSPAHAKAFVELDPCMVLDRGAVIHRLSLGKGKGFKIAPREIKRWDSNDAKKFRDETRAEGLIPVKAHEFDEWDTASKKLERALAARGVILNGQSEVVIEWFEETSHGPLLCKSMLDHLWLDAGVILDLKITENAAPTAIERTAENLGYAIQSAAYTRALQALSPGLAGRIKFLFAFVEPDEPWAVNLCTPDGLFRELGEQRWLRACATWAKCKAEDKFPAYGDDINQLSAPPWALSKEMIA